MSKYAKKALGFGVDPYLWVARINSTYGKQFVTIIILLLLLVVESKSLSTESCIIVPTIKASIMFTVMDYFHSGNFHISAN